MKVSTAMARQEKSTVLGYTVGRWARRRKDCCSHAVNLCTKEDALFTTGLPLPVSRACVAMVLRLILSQSSIAYRRARRSPFTLSGRTSLTSPFHYNRRFASCRKRRTTMTNRLSSRDNGNKGERYGEGQKAGARQGKRNGELLLG